jgi:hypothetical protein
MDSVRGFATANRSSLFTLLYAVVVAVAVYALYKYVAGAADTAQVLLPGVTSGRTGAAAPPKADLTVPLASGGDFTLSTWLSVDDWTYRAGKAKPVFVLTNSSDTSNALLVAALYATQPHLMLRFATKPATAGSSGSGGAAPTVDVTDMSPGGAFQQLVNGTGGASMGGAAFSSVAPAADGGAPVCDVPDLDLQRWVLLTLVVSGRVVDVYVDGKLARSCVLPGLPAIPAGGTNTLTAGLGGGFGGSLSDVRVYPSALTPDVVYQLYAGGPSTGSAAAVSTFGGWLLRAFGLQVAAANAAGAGATASTSGTTSS